MPPDAGSTRRPLRSLRRQLNRAGRAFSLVTRSTRVFGLPSTLQIEPTSRCNLSCQMCPQPSFTGEQLGDLKPENFRKLIDELENSLTYVNLTGFGEPMLNKELIPMIRYAREKGMAVQTTSNCTTLTEKNARDLVNSGLGHLCLSIDAASPEKYREIRGGDLDRALTGLRNLVEAKRSLKSETPVTRLNAVVMNHNLDEMTSIVETAAKWGVDILHFQRLHWWGTVSEPMKLKASEIDVAVAMFEEVRRRARDLGVDNDADVMLRVLERARQQNGRMEAAAPLGRAAPCYFPWWHMYIGFQGGVRLCCNYWGRNLEMGNAFEEPFRKIWNGERFREVRRMFLAGKDPGKECTLCTGRITSYWGGLTGVHWTEPQGPALRGLKS